MSFIISFQRVLTSLKRLDMCLFLLILVISTNFSSSSPTERKYDDDLILKTESREENLDQQYKNLDTSCLDKNAEFLFDLESKKCYEGGTRGPCNKNMRFYHVILEKKLANLFQNPKQIRIGECDCYREAPVPLVYHPETNQCYPLYRQSYCPDGQWLLYADEGPSCEPNPCLSEQSLDKSKFIVLLHGQCVATGAKCDPPAPSNEAKSLLPPVTSVGQFTVRFSPNKVKPFCSHPGVDIGDYHLGFMGTQSCMRGYRKDPQGRCRKTSNLSLSNRSGSPSSKKADSDSSVVMEEDDSATDTPES